MLVVMKNNAKKEEVEKVKKHLEENGVNAYVSKGDFKNVIGTIGKNSINTNKIKFLTGVNRVVEIDSDYKLASREFQREDTIISVNGEKFGGKYVGQIAGPCAIESYEQMDRIASELNKIGVKILRGGAFKPRTSPYSFQGLEEEGLKIMRRVADKYNMSVTSEIIDPSQIPIFEKYVNILQVGARNMQNFNLLKELGKIRKPVIIKRGLCATIEELLMSAEYVLMGGNRQVILCERGIRTFENKTRNTLDLSIIPIIKKLSHLPIIVDPSHGTGLRDSVSPMAIAAIAAGCDGVIVEVHSSPDAALCDGAQSLYPEQYKELCKNIVKIAPILGQKTGINAI